MTTSLFIPTNAPHAMDFTAALATQPSHHDTDPSGMTTPIKSSNSTTSNVSYKPRKITCFISTSNSNQKNSDSPYKTSKHQ